MRPIDRSDPARRVHKAPVQAKKAKPAARTPAPALQVAVTSNRCAPYLGPPSPQPRNTFQAAWQGVEEVLFERDLKEVAAEGKDTVEAYFADADVTRAVQRLAPALKEAVTRLAPNLAPRWPALDQYQDAVRMVHAFLYTYAPDADLTGDTDYAAMCGHAKQLSENFTRLGRLLSRDENAAAVPLMRAMSQRWTAYRHHQLRWQQSLLPATWKLEAQRLELNEGQVHAVLVEPRARLLSWQNLQALGTQLFLSMCIPPVNYAPALGVLADMRARLIDINPDDAQYLGEVLDTEELTRRAANKSLEPETLFRCCALVTSLLPPMVVNAKLYEDAAALDYPVSKLPEIMVETFKSLLLMYNYEHQKRLEAALPTICEQGPAWEKANFERLLKKARGHLPKTEAWLAQVQPQLRGNFQQRHAQALAQLIIGGNVWAEDACPEALLLSLPRLRAAVETLQTQARIAIAGKHLEAMGRAHRVDINPSDVQALQVKLLAETDAGGMHPLGMANFVIDEALTLFSVRRKFVERADLASTHLHSLLSDLTNLTGTVAETERAAIANTLAACLLKAPEHDATGRGVSKVQLRVEAIAKDLARLALVDVQVHGDYYAQVLQDITIGDTPDGPA